MMPVLILTIWMETMYATAEASKSACPSPDDYLRAFEGAKTFSLVTITGTLSE